MRGALPGSQNHDDLRNRSTPAHAGRTFANRRLLGFRTIHPRARGEGVSMLQFCAVIARFTPAHAGRTLNWNPVMGGQSDSPPRTRGGRFFVMRAIAVLTIHPRARGEDTLLGLAFSHFLCSMSQGQIAVRNPRLCIAPLQTRSLLSIS
jgi:hypothetical protein